MTGDMQPPRRTRPVRGRLLVDRVATGVLVLVLGAAALALTRIGALVAMPADVCADPGVVCDFSAITAGAIVARWAPLGILVIAIVVATLRVTRRRIAFLVPLLGIGAVWAVLLLAGQIVDHAISRR